MSRWCSLLLLVLLTACSDSSTTTATPGGSSKLTTSLLQGSDSDAGTEGFAQAQRDDAVQLPRDHGAHPRFRTEWWYVVGNLIGANGERFGYQLTFFRHALSPNEPDTTRSAWRSNQVFLAHFAVTDINNKQFYRSERVSRVALGMAGVQATPLRVWLKDWSISADDSATNCAGCLTLQLHASSDQVAIDLALESIKPAVLQGDQGYSVKSQSQQTASHYYSLTRLNTTGRVSVAQRSINVTGTSWLDREWSTSSLADDQAGWDWFALQTDDGREVMLYQLRLLNGEADAASAGVVVERDGQVTHLSKKDFSLVPTRHWVNPADGSRYPLAWSVQINSLGIELEVESLVDEQVHTGLFNYWEGAVSFQGQWQGARAAGWGYLELNGY